MIRNLSEEERLRQHRHKCSGCGSLSAADCCCEAPLETRDCPERIPGERNWDCPLMANFGARNITRLMTEEYARRADTIQRRDSEAY